MSETRSIWLLLAVAAAIMQLVGGLNYIVDPLQIFRAASFYRPLYSADTRLQGAGLIRSQEFDTAFTGTSLAVHYRQSEIDAVLGVKSLKLAMNGSSSREQSFVLSAALKRRPSNVLWQMDDWIFRRSKRVDDDRFLPVDLYRMNPEGFAEYLLSGSMAREGLSAILRSRAVAIGTLDYLAAAQVHKIYDPNLDDINTLPSYFDIRAGYNKTKAVASFAYYAAHPKEIMKNYHFDAMTQNFEHDALALIRNNQGANFTIFFPPYSILHTVAMRDHDPESLRTFYRINAYILERLAKERNVSVYDFRGVSEITHNLDNYSDVLHHSPVIDRKVLSMLAAREHLVDRETPTASLDRLKSQIENYRVPN